MACDEPSVSCADPGRRAIQSDCAAVHPVYKATIGASAAQIGLNSLDPPVTVGADPCRGHQHEALHALGKAIASSVETNPPIELPTTVAALTPSFSSSSSSMRAYAEIVICSCGIGE